MVANMLYTAHIGKPMKTWVLKSVKNQGTVRANAVSDINATYSLLIYLLQYCIACFFLAIFVNLL